jgi:hypothetical protein
VLSLNIFGIKQLTRLPFARRINAILLNALRRAAATARFMACACASTLLCLSGSRFGMEENSSEHGQNMKQTKATQCDVLGHSLTYQL